MSKLIALVATAVVLGGVRTVIQPGEELPELSKHDERELLQSGAAENPSDTAALAKADARATAETQAEFQAARERALQERASTNVGDGSDVGAVSASAAPSATVADTTTASPAPAPAATVAETTTASPAPAPAPVAKPPAAPAKAAAKTAARK